MSEVEPFEEAARLEPPPLADDAFTVDLDGYEGPLDLLLTLARQQKVDLKNLSILDLAEQYLAFIQQARKLRLEIAADYLVMAAWLAYLKSRLLLPDPPGVAELSGEEMAARLQFQLERLAAMRQVSDRLMARERLGYDVFTRGMPEGVTVLRVSAWDCTLYELLKAYADQVGKPNVTQLRVAPPAAFSIEEAIRRLTALLGRMPDWASLEAFLPGDLRTGFERRSAAASTFAASLELVKQGRLQMRQGQPFGPILVKGVEGG